jgi:hypothetical protein
MRSRNACRLVASCTNCGELLRKNARFCPLCGHPTPATTRVMEVPDDETGPVPVAYMRSEPHYYGVTPGTLVLVLALVALALAIILFAIGRWPFGLIALGLSLLLALVFFEGLRRRPNAAVETVRARAGAAADSVATRGRVAKRLFALRRELQRLMSARSRLLFELGDAVYRDDEQATVAVRAQLRELDELGAQKEAEMQTIVAEARERLEQRRVELQPTEMVELPEPPAAPGEGSPTGPAVIPEPYPPPDEGNPPEPAIMPEPGPLAPEEPSQEGRGA